MTADYDVAQGTCTPGLDNEGEDSSDNGTALRAHWTQEVRSAILESSTQGVITALVIVHKSCEASFMG